MNVTIDSQVLSYMGARWFVEAELGHCVFKRAPKNLTKN